MHVNECFVLRKVYGKSLLMPVRKNVVSDEPILLNAVACQIWEYASEGNSFDQIIMNLRSLYGLAAESDEENSIKIFMSELIEMRLIFDD